MHSSYHFIPSHIDNNTIFTMISKEYLCPTNYNSYLLYILHIWVRVGCKLQIQPIEGVLFRIPSNKQRLHHNSNSLLNNSWCVSLIKFQPWHFWKDFFSSNTYLIERHFRGIKKNVQIVHLQYGTIDNKLIIGSSADDDANVLAFHCYPILK